MLRFGKSNESMIVAMQGCTNIIVFPGHPCSNKYVPKVKGECDKKQQKNKKKFVYIADWVDEQS
jgi:hypothetical protein